MNIDEIELFRESLILLLESNNLSHTEIANYEFTLKLIDDWMRLKARVLQDQNTI